MKKSNKLIIGLLVAVVLSLVVGNVLIKRDVLGHESNSGIPTSNEPIVVDSVSADSIK